MVGGVTCIEPLIGRATREGNLVDSLLSETRGRKAAQHFFRGARAVVGHAPDRVTVDGHDAYARAIRTTLDRKVVHRRNRYLNNRLEQDHRGIKQRSYPMRGFGCFAADARFCTAQDELRDSFRCRQRLGGITSLAEQRRVFRDRCSALLRLIAS